MFGASVSRSLSLPVWMNPNTWHSWLRYSWTRYYLCYLYITCITYIAWMPRSNEGRASSYRDKLRTLNLLPPANEIAGRWCFQPCVCLSTSRLGGFPSCRASAPPPPPLYRAVAPVPLCTEYLSRPRHVKSSLLWSTYGRQADVWHPNGMISCLQCLYCVLCLLSLTKINKQNMIKHTVIHVYTTSSKYWPRERWKKIMS